MAKCIRIPPADRMLRCLRMPGLTGNEVRVLLALAYHDGPGGCWPADDTIATKSGLKHRSAVVTARNGLRRKGRLRWVHGQRVNTYEIAYGQPFRFDSQCPDFPDSDSGPTVREIRHSPSEESGPHCPSFSGSDSDPTVRESTLSLSEKSHAHCPNFPDTNWNELEEPLSIPSRERDAGNEQTAGALAEPSGERRDSVSPGFDTT